MVTKGVDEALIALPDQDAVIDLALDNNADLQSRIVKTQAAKETVLIEERSPFPTIFLRADHSDVSVFI